MSCDAAYKDVSVKNVDHITLRGGGHEECIEEISEAWPYVLECAELDRYPHRSCPWHWHQEVEIFYVQSGSLEYRTLRGATSFGTGSAGFVNAGVYHMTRATDEGSGTVQLCHIFRPGLLEDAGGRITERCIRPLVEARRAEVLSWSADSPQDARAPSLFRESFGLRPEDGAAYELRLRSLLSEIWALALEKARPLMDEGPASYPTHRDLRFEKMRDFVHEHYAETIEVADIASAGCTSVRDCFRSFRDYVGMGPAQYVREYRVRQSCRLLAHTSRTIESVALSCGFSSATQFSQTFRTIMGSTPSAYRARWRESDT